MRVLVINCGSATLKYKLFEDRSTGLELLAGAVVETTDGYAWCTGLGACPTWSGSTAGCSASCAR